jgi:GNAT superfamily N-acetyltransferase
MMPQAERAFRRANASDAAAIVAVVNAANLGTDGAPGWTHEAGLFEGPRIDVGEVLEHLAVPDSAFVLCVEGEEVVGCAYLKEIRSAAYMGLLAVRPLLQARGIGSALIAECERVAEALAPQGGGVVPGMDGEGARERIRARASVKGVAAWP